MTTEPDQIKRDRRKKNEDKEREASSKEFASLVGCAYPDQGLVASAAPAPPPDDHHREEPSAL